jgi:site-specific recombinase XerD
MFPKKNRQLDQCSMRSLFAGEARQASISEAVEAFLRFEMLGKSEYTHEWYERRLIPLMQWLGEDRLLIDIMEADLFAWYEGLQNRDRRYVGGKARPEIGGGLATDTLHGYVRACKRFFKWLYQKGILQADVSADLKLPRLPRRTKKGVTDTDAAQILGEAQGNSRDYAILKFLESTGARRGGVASLRLSNLNLDASNPRHRRRVIVREKGDQERTVLMTPSAVDAMEAWLKVRPNIVDDHVFLGKAPGKPWKALSEAGVSAILRRYKERLGITGRTSPHQWRHRFCRKRLQEGMNLKEVSQLAGHASTVVTSLFYSDFDIDDLQDSYDRRVKDLG